MLFSIYKEYILYWKYIKLLFLYIKDDLSF